MTIGLLKSQTTQNTDNKIAVVGKQKILITHTTSRLIIHTTDLADKQGLTTRRQHKVGKVLRLYVAFNLETQEEVDSLFSYSTTNSNNTRYIIKFYILAT
jgi:hypothetical protein